MEQLKVIIMMKQANEPNPPYPTAQPFFSQGFYDDPGIMIFSFNPNPFGNMFSSQDEPVSFPNHYHHSGHDLHYATHSLFQGQNPTTMTMITTNTHQNPTNDENEHETNKKSKENILPPMTDEEQIEYEKTVTENIKQFSAENLLNVVTCCITKGILRDPVVAADGFTYEREAILNWFKHSNRSPMTNQELENQELNSNHAIKSILQSLTEKKKQEKDVVEKTKIISDDNSK